MGRDFVQAHPECRRYFDEASAVLGYDLAQVCFEGPAEELGRSDRTQPAIFVVSMIAWDLLRARGIQPAAFAGHSAGEWAALCAAGVVSYAEALRVLEARGRLMQRCCEEHPGAMLAVLGGVEVPVIEQVAAASGVTVANFNSPLQIILSGTVEAIGRAEEACRAAGAGKLMRLPVAGAFHSPLMAPAAAAFAEVLAGVSLAEPSAPVACNVTGGFHADAASIRARMVEQITGSVRWIQNVEALRSRGASVFVECGPGRVLTGLVKRIDKTAALHNVADSSSLEAALTALAAAS
jgi:[acyl-carrier-protein] S-malonyltransferase